MNEVTSLSQFTRLRQPLSIGDVVSVSLAIAKQRWSLFCGISLRAIAWMILPIIGFSILVALSAGTQSISRSSASNAGIIVLFFVVWLVGSLYCFGKYLANAGLISRIAFNDLTQNPETVKDAARVTRSLTWSYLGASLLYGVIFIGAWIVLGIIFSIIFAVFAVLIAGMFGVGRGTPNPSIMGFVGLISILFLLFLFLGFMTSLIWVMARFFFSEAALSIEPKIGGAGAIARSWDLSTKSGWRLMTVTTVGFLITVPITALGQLITLLPTIVFRLNNLSESSSTLEVGLTSLLNLISTLVITLLTMGFWQAVKAVVYFDLLNSREGKSLEIQE
jgi:hypothetical protein